MVRRSLLLWILIFQLIAPSKILVSSVSYSSDLIWNGQTLFQCYDSPKESVGCKHQSSNPVIVVAAGESLGCPSDPNTLSCNSNAQLPMVYALEDTWTGIGIGLKASSDSSSYALSLLVYYGVLDVYNISSKCGWVEESGNVTVDGFQVQKSCSFSSDTLCSYITPYLSSSTSCPTEIVLTQFVVVNDISPFKLEISGKLSEISSTILNVKYKPNQYQNSLRLKSEYYNSASSKIRPYEVLNISLPDNSTFPVFLNILAIDNPPEMKSSLYSQPSACNGGSEV